MLCAPTLHRRSISFGREIALTRACITATAVLSALLLWSLGDWVLTSPGPRGPGLVIAQVVFVVGGAVLLYGALVYQVARLGYLQRARAFTPPIPDELRTLYDGDAPRLAVLVPSYREDPCLVRLTMLSAALQEHPRHRVVLLIDDPPTPGNREAAATLEETRRIPGELQRLLDEPARRFAAAHRDVRAARPETLDAVTATRHAAALWDEAATWFEQQAAAFLTHDHVEDFFRHEVLEARGAQHRATAADLRWRAANDPLAHAELAREHARLEALFAVDLSSFERKRHANLSHRPNKAMNLNSYIGLLGRTFRVEPGADGDHLVPDEVGGTLHVPGADYLITLDADSLLLPGYAVQLVHFMEQPDNERVALAQTPYSAFPGAPGDLERVAGATTDVMCLVHQGTSRYDAAYWVGANALLRTAALQDIAEHDVERGHPITRYIQDRTLVEDTESTIDLVHHGWTVVNYPARLAYSATPTDFGSLLVQRRRWANGGLLILPRFLRQARARGLGLRHLPRFLVRLNYLTSLASVNVAFLVLMAFSFEGVHAPAWLPLLAVPYFGLYARDLVQAGYRVSDVVRVYALTLLLIPVHLGGVVRSLQQAWTGRQVPFGRTPKVPTRTPVPALYVVATLLLLGQWVFAAGDDLGSDRNGRAVFTALNAGLLAHAVTRFLGWRSAVGDLWLRVAGRPIVWGTTPAPVRWGPNGARRRMPVWPRPAGLLGRLALVPVVLLGALTAQAFLQMANAPVEGLSSVPFPRMNVLVAGTDSREGLSAEARRALSLGDFEGARADTLFLLSVEGDRAAMLAFPRDLYVRRCDGTRGRINEALEIAGPACLAETVEDVSGIPVSHYVQMDFTGLVDVVDAVGGVTMTLEDPIVDDKTDANLPAGTQRLSGEESLAFVRVRSIDDDLGRIGRQQEFVEALAGQLVDRSVLANPLTAWRAVSATAGALTVDRDMGPIDMARLGYGVTRAVSTHRLATHTLPTNPRTVGRDEHVLVPDGAEAHRLYRSFADGSILRATPRLARGRPTDGAGPP